MTPQEISEQLNSDILSGEIPPGAALSQTDLAARFGVSRIPIRDALAHLSASGLIDAVPNKTARVISFSRAELIEVYDLRRLLEGDLLRRAIPTMTSGHLAAIDEALVRSNLEAKLDNWAQGDAMFHASLYAAAERPRQLAMVDQLRSTCRLHIAQYKCLPEHTDQWLADHKLIRDLCHAGTLRTAVKALDVHLKNACDTLLALMPQDCPARP